MYDGYINEQEIINMLQLRKMQMINAHRLNVICFFTLIIQIWIFQRHVNIHCHLRNKGIFLGAVWLYGVRGKEYDQNDLTPTSQPQLKYGVAMFLQMFSSANFLHPQGRQMLHIYNKTKWISSWVIFCLKWSKISCSCIAVIINIHKVKNFCVIATCSQCKWV